MDLTELTFATIMKWVLVVLAAGFIGQFGKSFASHLIAKARARQAAGQAMHRTPSLREDAGPAPLPTSAGAAEDDPQPGTPSDRLRAMPPAPVDGALSDKKTLKTLAKIRKKAMKSPKG